MLILENDRLGLTISPEAGRIALDDRLRHSTWVLDRATAGFRPADPALPYRDDIPGRTGLERRDLPPGQARRTDQGISVRYQLGIGTLEYLWTLGPDWVEVTLTAAPDEVEYAALPGSWRPARGACQLLLPIYQGILWRGDDRIWETTLNPGGHTGWSMAMGAYLGDRAGLLVTQESEADWAGTRGQTAQGPFFVFEQRRSAVEGWYPRQVRLYPVPADLTAVCKRYRGRVVERGEFVPWAEKIRRKPIVAQLFGALIAFVGYNQTDQIDYAASARRLHDQGFAQVFYSSVRMCQRTLNFKMGEDDPIWLSDAELAELKRVPGAFVGPWGWLYEALDDHSAEVQEIFRHGPDSQPVPNWRIDGFQWYEVCTPYVAAQMEERYRTDMAAMDWIHYDVVAMRPGLTCFRRDHHLHGKEPLGRRQGMKEIRHLLGPRVNGNRVVSSEGFVDRYAMSYDIGSTKLLPQWGQAAHIPVPMTMLVFHDSCIHDWWELHNYNAHGHRGQPDEVGIGLAGAGQPEKKAAMDALYGLPANLFPFGKQYGWLDVAARKSFSYLVTLDDPEVQRAIRAALPVCQLHRRIGRSELVSFAFASEDFALQTTQFADGTRILANLADEDQQSDQFGFIPANSWRVLAG